MNVSSCESPLILNHSFFTFLFFFRIHTISLSLESDCVDTVGGLISLLALCILLLMS